MPTLMMCHIGRLKGNPIVDYPSHFLRTIKRFDSLKHFDNVSAAKEQQEERGGETEQGA